MAARRDRAALRLMPFTGGASGRTSRLTAQRLHPFTRRELTEDLLPLHRLLRSGCPSALAREVIRNTLSARALRRAARRRLIRAPDPAQVGHLSPDQLSPGTDWEQLADQTVAWTQRRNATVPSGADHR